MWVDFLSIIIHMSNLKMTIFIIGGEGLGKIYGMIVKHANNILLIKEICNRYDFADAVLAIHPDATEKAMYIKTFEESYPELGIKLSEFINKT